VGAGISRCGGVCDHAAKFPKIEITQIKIADLLTILIAEILMFISDSEPVTACSPPLQVQALDTPATSVSPPASA
jgi:hypothetical protein